MSKPSSVHGPILDKVLFGGTRATSASTSGQGSIDVRSSPRSISICTESDQIGASGVDHRVPCLNNLTSFGAPPIEQINALETAS